MFSWVVLTDYLYRLLLLVVFKLSHFLQIILKSPRTVLREIFSTLIPHRSGEGDRNAGECGSVSIRASRLIAQKAVAKKSRNFRFRTAIYLRTVDAALRVTSSRESRWCCIVTMCLHLGAHTTTKRVPHSLAWQGVGSSVFVPSLLR